MIVARDTLGGGDLLVLDGRLQHHAGRELVDQAALDLLPRRLVRRILIAAVALQRRAAGVVLLLGDQDVGGALVQIDAHAVTRLEDGQTAAGSGLRRGVEDRRRPRGTGLAAVADAGERVDVLLDEVAGRPHIHNLGAAGIADRAGATHEQQAGFINLERRIVYALVIVLRAVEDDGAALEGVWVLRVL